MPKIEVKMVKIFNFPDKFSYLTTPSGHNPDTNTVAVYSRYMCSLQLITQRLHVLSEQNTMQLSNRMPILYVVSNQHISQDSVR